MVQPIIPLTTKATLTIPKHQIKGRKQVTAKPLKWRILTMTTSVPSTLVIRTTNPNDLSSGPCQIRSSLFVTMSLL